MLRKILLPTLAIAALAGCATGYTYRGGSGDYYYGTPGVDYRYHGAYGYYGSYGSYGGGYYYDRYGRLVYGYPYGGYYNQPYGAGSWWWYTPRPRPGHDQDGDHQGDDGNRDDRRRPPWRDIGGLQPRPPRTAAPGDDTSPRRQGAGFTLPQPRQASGGIAPRDQRMAPQTSTGSRMGGVIRNARVSESASEE